MALNGASCTASRNRKSWCSRDTRAHVTDVRCGSNGRFLASCGGTRLVVHDAGLGQRNPAQGHEATACSLSIHPDNKKVAVWGPVLVPNTIELAKSQVTVVEIATGKEILAFERMGRQEEASPSVRTGNGWRRPLLLDAQTGKKEFSLPPQNERSCRGLQPGWQTPGNWSGPYKVGEPR